jgi:maltooligosyltrehalose trehalohydrolase
VSVFRVWAPYARQQVQLVLGDDLYALRPAGDGWWQTEAEDVRPNTPYTYVVDGEDAMPDPRSPSQPNGVYLASRTLDHASFAWQHDSWALTPLGASVIYELHIGTFTPQGTFDATIDKLDYLTSLGVTHVELMPVAEFAGSRGWGYDGVDLYAPHHAYGGPDSLKRLVDACHARGLGVILDVVYNHLGPSGNYLERFGPYFSRGNTPWGQAINLDGPGSDEVRRFFIDNALTWLREYRIDGLRLDAVHAIFDTSALHFLEHLAIEVRQLSTQLDRRLEVIAESSLNDPRLVWPVDRGGYGLDATWCEDLHHALHAVLSGEHYGFYQDYLGVSDLAKALRHVYCLDGRFSTFRGRRHGRAATNVSGHNFVSFSQNHDMAGNRPQGERLSHIAGIGAAKVAAAIVLTAPTIPLLFMGEEWAASTPFLFFTDHDPETARQVHRGRMREFDEFGWPSVDTPAPNDPATFERSRLDWSELGRPPHSDMLDWYKKLIELRRSTPALHNGRLDAVEVAFDEGAGWLELRRGTITLVVNLSDDSVRLPAISAGNLVLASHESARLDAGDVCLPRMSVALLRRSS